MGEVEAAAGLQPHHQRLRRVEIAAAVEQVAQAPAGEVLDDDVHRRALADLLLTPVVARRRCCGCDSDDIVRIAVANRSRNSADSAHSGRTSLTVTGRSSSTSSASTIRVLAPADTIRVDPVALAEHTPGEAATGPRRLGWSVGAHVVVGQFGGRPRTRRTLSPRRPRDDATVGLMPLAGVAGTALRHHGRWHSAVARPNRRPPARRVDRKLLAASLAIAVGLVLIGVALSRSVTGDEAADLPERDRGDQPLPPSRPGAAADAGRRRPRRGLRGPADHRRRRPGDDPPRRARLGRRRARRAGRRATGAVFEPGNATLTFTPGDGAPIERFDPGSHTVTVIYWRTDEGEAPPAPTPGPST